MSATATMMTLAAAAIGVAAIASLARRAATAKAVARTRRTQGGLVVDAVRDPVTGVYRLKR